ncbi:hypothetical protein T484DRAFT_1801893 [Baffinella frigidus]|nr:hypothetical protein T484DRAFT_1801893 [Cryptophyta sp. CCMP2293]
MPSLFLADPVLTVRHTQNPWIGARTDPVCTLSACAAAWHLSHYLPAHTALCKNQGAIERLEDIALSEDPAFAPAKRQARGALFVLGIIPHPTTSESMVHCMLSYVDRAAEQLESMVLCMLSYVDRAAEQAMRVKGLLEEANYVVYTVAESGLMDDQFSKGIGNCACFIVCLTGDYQLSAKTRTELLLALESTEPLLAYDWKKPIMLLDMDDESREPIMLLDMDDESHEESWMTGLIRMAPNVDFTDPEEDEYHVKALVEWLGKRGKKTRDDLRSKFESGDETKQKLRELGLTDETIAELDMTNPLAITKAIEVSLHPGP